MPIAATAPTNEQLLDAWRQRRRPDWPTTFEATMQDPLYARLVRTHALHGIPTRQRPVIERPEPPQVAGAAPMPPARPATTAARAAPAPSRQAALFDRKRLAAGERDDDDEE